MSDAPFSDPYLLKVFAYLLPPHLCKCSLVSRKWHDLSESNALWQVFTQYITEPPKGAWVPQTLAEVKTLEQKNAEKETKWDGSNALQWLKQQRTTQYEGGIPYMIKTSTALNRSEKKFFKDFAGRGWHYPQFILKSSAAPRVILQSPKMGSDVSKEVYVDGRETFVFGDASSSADFWFTRVESEEEQKNPPIFPSGHSSKDLAEKLSSGKLSLVNDKLLNRLGAGLKGGPSCSYDVAYIKVWPQFITTGRSSNPADYSYSFGDVWRNEFHAWWYGMFGNEESPMTSRPQSYYRCWTKSNMVNLCKHSPVLGTEPGPDSLLTLLTIPIQRFVEEDFDVVDRYKELWKQKENELGEFSDKLFVPTVVTTGFWDERKLPAENKEMFRVDVSLQLVNFIIDGHHKLQAAAELNKPVMLLAFIEHDYNLDKEKEQSAADQKRKANKKKKVDKRGQSAAPASTEDFPESATGTPTRGLNYPSQVFLKLESSWLKNKPPRQQPVRILTRKPVIPPYFIRFGYAHSYAIPKEIASQLRRSSLKAKQVMIGPPSSDFEVVVQLQDSDFKTLDKVFFSIDPRERAAKWRNLGDLFQRIDIRLPVPDDVEKYDAWIAAKEAEIWRDTKPSFRNKRNRRNNRGGRRSQMRRGGRRSGGGRGRRRVEDGGIQYYNPPVGGMYAQPPFYDPVYQPYNEHPQFYGNAPPFIPSQQYSDGANAAPHEEDQVQSGIETAEENAQGSVEEEGETQQS
eukprot:TRINITY_DN9842_c0_g1_i1.p1 TRINITY_DN9842_c0_g1~~TRINITY_DN9842_c0_g1_i1.p1  ORF type:complete len:740 (+),score=133.40 TRINITY_DN9842_c0_g1_i1:76-2295(+)